LTINGEVALAGRRPPLHSNRAMLYRMRGAAPHYHGQAGQRAPAPNYYEPLRSPYR